MKVLSGHRPDITPAQLVGVLVAGIPIFANLLHVFGVFDLSHEQEQALQDTLTWGGVLAGLLFGSDAAVRASRNHADAKVQAAAVAATGAPVDPPAVVPGEDGLAETGDDDEELPSDDEEFAGGGPDDAQGPESRIEPVAPPPETGT